MLSDSRWNARAKSPPVADPISCCIACEPKPNERDGAGDGAGAFRATESRITEGAAPNRPPMACAEGARGGANVATAAVGRAAAPNGILGGGGAAAARGAPNGIPGGGGAALAPVVAAPNAIPGGGGGA